MAGEPPQPQAAGSKAAEAPEQPAAAGGAQRQASGAAPEGSPLPAPSKQPALPLGPEPPPALNPAREPLALNPAQPPAASIRSSPMSPNAPWPDLPVPSQSIADGPPPEIHVRWEPTIRGGPPRPLNAAPVVFRSPTDERLGALLGADRGSIADQANVPLIPGKDGQLETVPSPTGFPNAFEHTVATSIHLQGKPFGHAAEHQAVGTVLDAVPAMAALGLGARRYGSPVWQGAKALGRAFRAGYNDAPAGAGGSGIARRITRALGTSQGGEETSGDNG